MNLWIECELVNSGVIVLVNTQQSQSYCDFTEVLIKIIVVNRIEYIPMLTVISDICGDSPHSLTTNILYLYI